MAITKVLIVDDEPRVCQSMTYLLKTKDYEVATASCGQEALALLADHTFDLAILDVHLPDMLGTQIMGMVKAQNPNTIVIIITGDADLDSAIASLKSGAYDYLKKPFEFEELLKTVENALNQKALKEQKDQINQQLYLSEKKYRYLVQNSPDIIYTLDDRGNFTFLSDAVEPLLGYRVHDLIGQSYNMLLWEEDREKARWHFAERRSKSRSSSVIEFRLKEKVLDRQKSDDTPYITVELKSMGIYERTASSGQQRFVGTHGVLRDISEKQRLQYRLRNAERMESLGTLAGGIAHDFNNLLMGIQGRSTLISMDLEATDPFREHLQAIEDYIHSASDLTQQLLGFARGGKYDVAPTDINTLIQETAKMFGRTKKEIVINTEFHDANIVVEVDQSQIEQVLLNMYVNAWQAMPEGGTLRLETEKVLLSETSHNPYELEPGRYVHVMIKDSGIGMSQETIKRIFDPFFTTKEKGRGTGLGLASAYGIIKNHCGTINVHSEVGRGTTFHIYLPISEKLAVKQSSPDQRIRSGSETVLLVDDEAMIIDVGKLLLNRLGYQVVTATSGEEAVDMVRSLGKEIDLVILDMIMPGLDGGKTFDRIREFCPDLPVMLSSGYAINDQAEKILNKGCNGFIQKPFTFAAFSQKLRQAFEHICN